MDFKRRRIFRKQPKILSKSYVSILLVNFSLGVHSCQMGHHGATKVRIHPGLVWFTRESLGLTVDTGHLQEHGPPQNNCITEKFHPRIDEDFPIAP